VQNICFSLGEERTKSSSSSSVTRAKPSKQNKTHNDKDRNKNYNGLKRPHAKKAGKRKQARTRSGLGLIQHCWRKCHLHERLPIVTTLVAFPPNQSSDQPNEGIKTFPMGFNDQLSGGAQPDN
jgi:hypothetical protein